MMKDGFITRIEHEENGGKIQNSLQHHNIKRNLQRKKRIHSQWKKFYFLCNITKITEIRDKFNGLVSLS